MSRVTQNYGYWMSLLGLFLVTLLFGESAFAEEKNVGTVAAAVTSTMGSLAQLITATSYIAGLGFAIGSILKFKQHKDNPTQIPIGTPVALLFVAAALLFLPSILETAGGTLFGTDAKISGVGGQEDVGSVYSPSG